MKILLVVTGLKLGGAEKQVCALADEFHRAGHDVQVCSLRDEIEVLPEESGVSVVSLRLSSALRLPFAFKAFSIILQSFLPDVVHSHMFHANQFCRLSRFFFRLPWLVSTSHSSFEGGVFRRTINRLTFHLSDVSTNVSLEAIKCFEVECAAPKGEMRVVYNGLNLERLKSGKDVRHSEFAPYLLGVNKKILLAVGRITEAKDYHSLIRSMSLIKSAAALFIVGDGDRKLTEELLALVCELQLQDRIFLVGARNNIPDLMKSVDLFILSSEWEGLPTVVGEAIMAGCPVVSTDAGGSREWFPPDKRDQLVPVRNEYLLADAIDSALSLSSDEACSNSRCLMEYVEKNFSIANIAEQWLKIYSLPPR